MSAEGYLTDESSFYGDDDEIAELEHRASLFDLLTYWKTSHAMSLSTIAAAQRKVAEEAAEGAPILTTAQNCNGIIEEVATSRHYHDGKAACRQLTETVAEFVARLPPSTTPTSVIGPWIYIANRHVPYTLTAENIRGLKKGGEELLTAYEEIISLLQHNHKCEKRATLTRCINHERRKLELGILECARENNVVSGKWMLFPSVGRVDEAWAAVAGATAKGELGLGAKVAARSEGGPGSWGSHLIAIYTSDISDKEDIRRVLVKLRDMGFVTKGAEKSIYYKCDAYTYLDIMGGNKWGLKPSMHSSNDVFERKW
ncbi:hypothetical protein AJ80_02075 [Polytolypa hystricis UAMH7299]|uniref:DUF1917 domain-containing protein n=1 Tax=Polytolypa hystricis (strain UAMH7299) TaxID=1447883 RepID=A0A2B7YT72_POLH7|nr:hypothetical protein AJ80_02075 [Polytolypa hystricis UAMH7299]